MALGPVDADGDLSTGGAELLEEAAIGADPQVVLSDLHLQGSWPSPDVPPGTHAGPAPRPPAPGLTAQR